jgi:hypothetical protein
VCECVYKTCVEHMWVKVGGGAAAETFEVAFA